MSTIINYVQLVGNLAADPEIRTVSNGKKVANFSLACNESYLDKEGRKIESVQWIKCVAWEELATILEKYAKKGKQVAVAGKIQNKQYVNKEGVKRFVTEILVSEILLLGGNRD